MQSPAIEGLTKRNNIHTFPSSPTLLKAMNIDDSAYLHARNKLISKKNLPASYDDRLRDYQNQDVVFLMSLKSKAVFNQQRTGKTPTTLTTMRLMNEHNNLIICPGSIIYRWQDEFKKWHGGPVQVLDSRMTKKKRIKEIKNFKGTLIMSYGIARNDVNDLLKRQPENIVVDEAHRLRNYKGMRSPYSPQLAKAIIKIAQNTEKHYALTGTPVPNKPENIYGILAFLFPKLFNSYWGFINYYFKVEDRIINAEMDSIKEIVDFKNPQKKRELQEFLETISIQRKRKDVMQWLKEVEPTPIKIPPTKKQLNYLKELREYFEIAEEELTTINILERMLREQQVATEPKLLDLNAKGVKTEWIKEYINDYPEKSIIFVSKFTSYLKYLNKEHIKNAILLTGETTNKKRQEIETAFNDKKIQIILANIDVAKEGMTLYGADTMVFIDTSLTYTDNEQCMDRLLPTTEQIAAEKEDQEIILLRTDTPIENYLYKMLKLKKSKTDIINDYKRFLARPYR